MSITALELTAAVVGRTSARSRSTDATFKGGSRLASHQAEDAECRGPRNWKNS
jgi:hypothetical protein